MLQVKKVNYENEFEPGCETCDWGSNYISNIEIIFKDEMIIRIETSQMYDYTLTEADYMIILSTAKNYNDFYCKFFETIENKGYDVECRVELEKMEIKINGSKINIAKSCEEGRPVKEG